MKDSRGELEQYSEKMRLLTSPTRIDTIDYLREKERATLEDLTGYLEGAGYENVTAGIIHVHLPMLEDYGILEQDENSIKYKGDKVIEEVMETLEALETR